MSASNKVVQMFDSYIKKVLINELRNSENEIQRYGEKIKLFSELSYDELCQLIYHDKYEFENAEKTIRLFGSDVVIYNPKVYEILQLIPTNNRNIILLKYFLNKTDVEIGKLFGVASNTITTRRIRTLKKLKKILEAKDNEMWFNAASNNH